ncbi:MAG TPA: PIG-L family deacetylase, partial [Verrucomicrobiae bacterium]
MNPYQDFVSQVTRAVQQAKSAPLGGFAIPIKPTHLATTPKALIFSPHPDDEVIIGGLALRLLRELAWNVLNVAVTQGSSKARQAERWKELQACCDYVGFGLVATRPNGLEGINLVARAQNAANWETSVERIVEILSEHQPRAI